MKLSRKNRRSDRRTFRGRTLDVSLRGDPRNADFPMSSKLVPGRELPIQTKRWHCPVALDQGSEGACVGFAGAHFYGTEDRIQEISVRLARRFYKGAQRNDQWPGEDYEGTSVNALMKFLHAEKLIGSYYWIHTADELFRTLSYHGPVIMGCLWLEECFTPWLDGVIRFKGEAKGGHATCWRGIDDEKGMVIIQQSWGPDHGDYGTVYMPMEDVEVLMRTNPQCVFPEKRSLNKFSSADSRRPLGWFRKLW